MKDMDNELNGLEMMKEQIALLKHKLDNEAIVNDRLMRRVMNEKVDDVRRYTLKVSIIGVVAMVLMYYDCTVFHLSTVFLVFTEMMLLGAVTFTIYNRRLLGDVRMMDGNLIEASKSLLRFKKREIRYLNVSLPTLLVWVIWIMYEFRAHTSDSVEADILCISGGIGAVLGACIGIHLFRKMLRNINDVIEQIEEVKGR